MCCHAYANLETWRKLVSKLSCNCFWDCYWGRTGQLLRSFSRRKRGLCLDAIKFELLSFFILSLSMRRFWGKGERWKRKRERAEGEKRLTQMLLLEPSTPTQHDSIPSNQNHFRSLGCQLHVSKSSPKINLTLRSGRAPVLVLLRFRFFLKPPMGSFRILVM